MWFDFARFEKLPTIYNSNKTAVTVDVLEAGLILSIVIIGACFYFVLTGLRGKRMIVAYLRVTLSLLIGGIILVGNFGQEWEVGEINTRTPYKAGTGVEINANIAVKIGFRSVNVTLKADSPKNTVLEKEMINYNERFEWTWDQGRFGFGPYSGHLQQSFRAAQYRGLPLPILWVVDYFVFDGEYLRFGRFYRTAGWYAHIAMWTAFPCWLLANIFFQSVVRYGTNFLGIAGLLQLLACLIWGVVRNPMPLIIPFEDDVIRLKYGSSFYVTLFGGILCVVLSVVIYLFNMFYPEATADFFGIDPLSDFEESHLTPNELQLLRKGGKVTDIPLSNMHDQQETDDPGKEVRVLKRRSTVVFKKHNQYRNINYDDQPEYTNYPLQTVSEEAPLHPSGSSPLRKVAPPLPPKRR